MNSQTYTMTQTKKPLYLKYPSNAFQIHSESLNNSNNFSRNLYEDSIKKARETLNNYQNSFENEDNSNKYINNLSTDSNNNNITKPSYREIKYSNDSFYKNISNSKNNIKNNDFQEEKINDLEKKNKEKEKVLLENEKEKSILREKIRNLNRQLTNINV